MDPITTLLVLPVAASILATARPPYERYLEQYYCSQAICRENTEHALAMRIPAATEIFLITTPVVQDKHAMLRETIAQFAALADGWDGDGSLKPSAEAISAAKKFLSSIPPGIALPTPMVTSRGDMEFYWNLRTGYVDISFDVDGVGSFFARDRAGSEIFLDDLGTDFRHFPEQPLILSVLAPHLLMNAA